MPEDPINIKYGFYSSRSNRLQFVRQVEDLCGRLTKVLKDSTQVGSIKNKDDPEYVADLYFRIAKGYMSTPEVQKSNLFFELTFKH